jgi:hypothetical protein
VRKSGSHQSAQIWAPLYIAFLDVLDYRVRVHQMPTLTRSTRATPHSPELSVEPAMRSSAWPALRQPTSSR